MLRREKDFSAQIKRTKRPRRPQNRMRRPKREAQAHGSGVFHRFRGKSLHFRSTWWWIQSISNWSLSRQFPAHQGKEQGVLNNCSFRRTLDSKKSRHSRACDTDSLRNKQGIILGEQGSFGTGTRNVTEHRLGTRGSSILRFLNDFPVQRPEREGSVIYWPRNFGGRHLVRQIKNTARAGPGQLAEHRHTGRRIAAK